MGHYLSVPNYYELSREESGTSFLLISNDPPSSLLFDPIESYIVAYGIDKQTNPKFAAKTLSSITVADAKQVLDALVHSGMVPRSNAHLYAASKDIELCKIDGMKRTFQECARKVGPNGLFVFHFSGHGIKVKSSEWGLAPVDFDYTQATYLTSEVLSRWLNEVDCKARHILFSLDSCYAGGIASELTQSSDLSYKGSFYVLSACTANETSLVVGSLGHSIFTYFLSHAILKLCQVPGELPLQMVYSECYVCSEALSSLFIRYNSGGELEVSHMQPQMDVLNLRAVVMEIIGEDEDQVDAQMNRFRYAVELYNRRKSIDGLDEKTMAYIDTVTKLADGGPLIELNKRHLLTGRVLETAICSMMYSIAAIELACDTSRRKVSNVNLSITAFIYVASALDVIVHNLVIPENVFFMSWLFYKEVLVQNGVNINAFSPLDRKLSHNTKFCLIAKRPSFSQDYQPVSSDGDNMTDSAEMVSCITSLSCDLHTHNIVFQSNTCTVLDGKVQYSVTLICPLLLIDACLYRVAPYYHYIMRHLFLHIMHSCKYTDSSSFCAYCHVNC